MSPSESEDDTKRTELQPEPLCLFYFTQPAHHLDADECPDVRGVADHPGRTYVAASFKEERSLKVTPRRQAKRSPESSRRAKLDDRKGGTDSSKEGDDGRRKQRGGRKKEVVGKKKDEDWLQRKAGRFRKKRKLGQEGTRSLRSYLLTAVKDDQLPLRSQVPSLADVLHTIEDAWPPNKPLAQAQDREEQGRGDRRSRTVERPPQGPHFAQPLMNRRFSMPEEVMRKYTVVRERTSEESEETRTMPEITSPSSKEPEEQARVTGRVLPSAEGSAAVGVRAKWVKPKTEALQAEVFAKKIDEHALKVTRNAMTSTKGPDMSYLTAGKDKSFVVLSESGSPLSTSTEPHRTPQRKLEEDEELLAMIEQCSGSDSDDSDDVPDLAGAPRGLRPSRTVKRAPLRRGSVVDIPEPTRVTQHQYYNQGKGIIHLKAVEKSSQTGQCTCRGEQPSSTTASAGDGSEDSASTETISSPAPCDRKEDDSDNLSSESDIHCTCADLTSSKETSSDRFHSGKSTLSQTVSDKTVSTQDSTVSINSVSTRGSTISANSNSTSPEIDPRTSAKETTTSPDHTPRTPRSRGRPFTRSGRKGGGRRQGPHGRNESKGNDHDKTCPKYGRNHPGQVDAEPRPSGEKGKRQRKTSPAVAEDLYNIPDKNVQPERRHEKLSSTTTAEHYEVEDPTTKDKARARCESLQAEPPQPATTKRPEETTPRFLAEDLYNIPDRNVQPDPTTCRFHGATKTCVDNIASATPRHEHVAVNITPEETYSSDTSQKKATETNGGKEEVKEVKEPENTIEKYKWSKLSKEELYMIQQQRHRKFVENQRRFSIPLAQAPDTGTLAGCAVNGSAYKDPPREESDLNVMVPRFSALPRSLSMLVNTSSADTSMHNSDSDSHSLADSLEDHPTTRMHRLHFDTKLEAKPVRGDITQYLAPGVARDKHQQPKGRAFFVSITEKASEDAVLTDISKIPEPPEKIKNQIFERHSKICKKSVKLYSHIETQTEMLRRGRGGAAARKNRPGVETSEKKTKVDEEPVTARVEKPTPKETKSKEIKRTETTVPIRKKEGAGQEVVEKREKVKEATLDKSCETEEKSLGRKHREGKGKFHSKIPVPINDAGRSTSSSPEREPATYPGKNFKRVQKKPPPRMKAKKDRGSVQRKGAKTVKDSPETEEKPARKVQKEQKVVKTGPTPVPPPPKLTDEECAPQKPQAVIHPSPAVDQAELNQRRLSFISSIESTATILKLQQVQMPQRPWSKPMGQPKRSPNMKFQQRFEVIPEERSSSLTSSAEERWSTEKNRRRSLPVKLTEIHTGAGYRDGGGAGEALGDRPHVRRYSLGSISNIIIAKLMGRPLQAIPCIQRGPNNENQQIIVLSPKDALGAAAHSSKGRDALLAMNRADFNRLSQGWMNFYLLNPTSDASEGSNAEEDGGVARRDKQYTLTNFEIIEETEGEATPDLRTGKQTQKPGERQYIIQNVQDNVDIDQNGNELQYVLKDLDGDEECTDGKHCGKEKTLWKREEKDPSNTIVCRIPSIEKDSSQTTSGDSGEGNGAPCAPGSGHCGEGNADSYTVFLSNQNSPSVKQGDDVKTSEFLLVEKADNPELMCLNGTEEARAEPMDQDKDCTCQAPKPETNRKEKRKKPRVKKEVKSLDENVRLHCSSTILQTTKPIVVSPRTPTSKRQSSLPELRTPGPRPSAVPKAKSSVDILPKVSAKPSDHEDSDSTVYFQPPSPRVPPLPLEGSGDFMSDDTISSSDEEQDSKVSAPPLPVRYLPLRKRGFSNRTRAKKETYHESPRIAKPGGGSWTVTVAGTVELSHSAPDVKMRLSFPGNPRPPVASQSDSGFAEEANPSQNLDHGGSRRQGSLLPPANVRQRWTVTVKNPSQGGSDGKLPKKSYSLLPDLGQPFAQPRNAKKGHKTEARFDEGKKLIERKITELWPRVEEIVHDGLVSCRLGVESGRLDAGLSVEGTAVALGTKPRVLTMTERDLTRSNTARSAAKTPPALDIDLRVDTPASILTCDSTSQPTQLRPHLN